MARWEGRLYSLDIDMIYKDMPLRIKLFVKQNDDETLTIVLNEKIKWGNSKEEVIQKIKIIDVHTYALVTR